MIELEDRLRDLGRHVDFPPPPGLGAVVRARIEAGGTAVPMRRRLSPRALLIAAAVLLLTPAAVLAASPSARDAVLEWFGLRGATVERRERVPDAPRARPRLGTPITAARAHELVAFRIMRPRALGAPDDIYYSSEATGGLITLAYRPRPELPVAAETGLGLLVAQFRGDLDPQLLAKTAAEGGEVRELGIDGHRALWIAGGHAVVFRGADGNPQFSTLRLSANALLVERGRLLVRLEADLPLARMTAIARSLR